MTFIRLAFLCWYCEHEPPFLTGLVDSLPAVEALIVERGDDETFSAEASFTLAILWNGHPPLDADEPAYSLRARTLALRAAAREPDSRVFSEWRFWLLEAEETLGPKIYIEQELHARYSGRGEMGRYVLHQLRSRLRPLR